MIVNESLDEWNRKDARPCDSINYFTKILKSIGLKTEVTDMKNYNGLWYSCRVIFSELPNIGTNGKGVSEEYAIASAYGELFERLQSDTLISEYFPNKNNNGDVLSDICLAKNILKKYIPHIFGHMPDKDICDMLTNYKQFQKFAKYYSAEDKTNVLLPDKIIYFLCGTNGISAGNSYEEACVQGLSEIFERYVMKQLHMNGNSATDFPNLSDKYFKNTKSYSLITAIRIKGYECYIKDCTLGGKFPVLGVLIMDSSRKKYCFNLGCDLNIDICLQRCITEIFQGFDFDVTFRMQMNSLFDHKGNWWNIPIDVNKGLVKSIFDGTGQLPYYMLDTKTYKEGVLYPFENDKMSNSECLMKLIEILHDAKKKLYIRNCNYLGVPAVRIYIPEFTEAFLYDYDILKLINSIYRLKSYTGEYSQLDMFEDLATILNYPTYSNSVTVSKLCGILYDNPNNQEIADIHYLYGCVALHLGEYNIAKQYYKNSYSSYYGMKSKDYIDYMSCIIDAIEYNIPAEHIKYLFCGTKDEDLITKLIDQLYFYKEVGVTDIKCTTCDKCNFFDGCLYNEWNSLYEKYCNAKKLERDAFEFFAENLSKNF